MRGGAAPSPAARRRLRQPLAAPAQPAAAPGSAAGAALPQQPRLPVSPDTPKIPTGRFLASRPLPVLVGLRRRFLAGALPAGDEAGLRGGGRFAAAALLPAGPRLGVALADPEEPAAVRLRRAGIGSDLPAGGRRGEAAGRRAHGGGSLQRRLQLPARAAAPRGEPTRREVSPLEEL